MVTTSIALATFNGEEHLEGQLDSFAAQSLLPDELIVSDDRSSDGTLDLVRQFRETAPFKVEIHVNEHRLGYAQNFSRAMSLCRGDLVFLSDQDDVWLPQKVATIVGVHERRRGLLYVNDLRVMADSSSYGPRTFLHKRFLGSAPRLNVVKGCATTVSSELLAMALPVPASQPHDAWLHGFAQALDGRTIVPSVLQKYRLHADQASGVVPTRRIPVAKMLSRRVAVSGDLLAARCLRSQEVATRLALIMARDAPLLQDRGLDAGLLLGRLDHSITVAEERLRTTQQPTLARRIGHLTRGSALPVRSRYSGAREVVRDLFFP